MKRGVFILQVKNQPFRSTSEVPTQIPEVPTTTENTVHNESEVHGRKSVSELPANVGTSDGRNSRRASGLPTVGTPDGRRDFRRAQLNKQPAPLMPGLPAWVRSVSELPANVRTFDCRNSRRTSGLPTSTDSEQSEAQVPGLLA